MKEFIKHITKITTDNIGNAATKRIIKQFASKFHFVYFGHVDPREDEYELVRGATVSHTHVDNHYTVGSYNGHDVVLVERRNILKHPTHPNSSYRWIIMQVDLKRDGLPHVFIDTRHHDATFYANAFLSASNMQDVTSYIGITSNAFLHNCRLFANPATYAQVGAVLRPEIVETIAHHFTMFDYEFFDDRVLIYASNNVITPATLTDMLQIGIWLAEQLNAVPRES